MQANSKFEYGNSDVYFSYVEIMLGNFLIPFVRRLPGLSVYL